jgi:hypothetical protein
MKRAVLLAWGGGVQVTQFVIMGGINLEDIRVAAAGHIQRVLVLLYVYLGLLAAAAVSHRIENSTVFESHRAKV